MKNSPRFFIILIVIVAAAFLSMNFLIKNAILAAIKQTTGASAKIGQFNLNILKQEISIKEFVLYNPPSFPQAALVDIPELTVSADAAAFLKRSVHLPLLIINLRELTLVKNSEGKLNVDSLAFVQNPENKKIEKSEKGKDAELSFKIDRMNLTIGKVVYQDYSSAGSEPKVKTYDIGIKGKEFKNVTSPQQLASLLLVQAMTPTAVRSAAVTAVSTVQNLESLAVDKAAGFLDRIKEKLK